ncbi:MAG: biopolymer transporter ExbD [Methylacidiphilales bacterium]|nr:biopolymer transporter ExbD [Candidatus Methylacidiphilales bacterium]
MKLRRNIKPLGAGFDMTPLIDMVLTLIIFFILSSTFVLQPGVKVNLPRGPSHGGIRDIRYVLNVTAQDPPVIFLNDQVITMEKLEGELKRISKKQADATVVLRADRNVPHGFVTEILTHALAADVGVVIATQPPGADSGP